MHDLHALRMIDTSSPPKPKPADPPATISLFAFERWALRGFLYLAFVVLMGQATKNDRMSELGALVCVAGLAASAVNRPR